VYAAEVVLNGGLQPAVLNIGCRPTLRQATAHRQFEVHLLDLEMDLYDRELEVIFRRRLRGEQRFGSMTELTVQIRQDVEAARECLGSAPRERR
jgi:riboflavin kinase/FMN adenylyltransferase